MIKYMPVTIGYGTKTYYQGQMYDVPEDLAKKIDKYVADQKDQLNPLFVNPTASPTQYASDKVEPPLSDELKASLEASAEVEPTDDLSTAELLTPKPSRKRLMES